MKHKSLAAMAMVALLAGGVTMAQSNGGGGAQRGPGRGQRPPGAGQGGSEQHGQPGEGGGGGGGNVGGEPRGGPNGRGGPTSRPSPDQLFDMADSNKDGSLSRDEFKKFIESHRPQRPPRGPEGGEGDEVGSGNRRPPPPPKE
jgi:hypothetical protein